MMADSSVHRRTFLVELKAGLHMRPCSMIAACASRFSSDIHLIVDQLTLNAKSALDLMSLGADRASYGTEVVLEASGEDSEEALAAIGMLFENGFPVDGSSSK